MEKLIFEGVRCFRTHQECPLTPLTLLVGENSSGKSTFLALTRIAWDIARGDLTEDLFNEEPFLLGAYDQVASYRGGKAGRVKSFAVGCQIPLKEKFSKSTLFSDRVEIVAQFTSQGAQAKLDEWKFVSGQFQLEVKFGSTDIPRSTRISTRKGTEELKERGRLLRSMNPIRLLGDPWIFLAREYDPDGGKREKGRNLLDESEVRMLMEIRPQVFSALGFRPYAFAPIRTRPQRTYDPLKEVPRPEGSHVPMVLAKTFSAHSAEWERLRDALVSFGKASGLFSDVEVRRKGQKESDPFQIAIKTFGPSFNLVDVGYGVSQILPIIVDAIQGEPGSTFLLQQPEVHLHPRAQAQLGSFLAALAKEQRKRFIVETHSDHLLDRVRMDIRDRKFLTPEDVAILYFERVQGGVEIHHLHIDHDGNLVNTPPSYRQFFLQEEERMFLGIGEDG
jgi:predicted ATPase